MRRVSVTKATRAAVVAACAIGACLIGACSARPASDGKRLRVLFTGETACELEVCDCGGKMLGGVGALGGFFARQEGCFLLVDTGCMACGTRPDERLRFEALLRGMALMGYDAVNVGEYELWLGEDLADRPAEDGVPFVSANVFRAGGTQEHFEGHLVAPWLLVEKGGLRVAVTGVVAGGSEREAYRAGPGVRVDDPFEALARVIPAALEGADAVVVLADLSEEAAREVARRFPEVSLVLFRGRGDSVGPEIENRSAVASVSGLGRYVGEVVLDLGGGGEVSASGTPVQIDDSIADDERVVEASLRWYRRADRSGTHRTGKAAKE